MSDDFVGLMFVGSICVLIGLFAIARKRFTLPFGRIGFVNPKPVFMFVLTQAHAVRFGFVSLVDGLFMIGVGLHTYITHNQKAIFDGVLKIIFIFGISILIFVFLFELFMEFLANLRNRAMNKEGNNGKRSDATNN